MQKRNAADLNLRAIVRLLMPFNRLDALHSVYGANLCVGARFKGAVRIGARRAMRLMKIAGCAAVMLLTGSLFAQNGAPKPGEQSSPPPSGVPAAAPFPLAPPPGPQIYPTPLNDSDEGFRPIFNGNSLDGWEGDPRYWRVEDREIVGEVTPATLLKQNNFLIWRGGEPANFELKAVFRITGQGN